MAVNLVMIIVLIFIVLVSGYLIWRTVSKSSPSPSYTPFVLDYSNIGEPGVSFDGSTPVPTYIPPEDVVQLFTDSFIVSDGDVLLLESSTGQVYQRKVLNLDFLSKSNGDWSMLYNLQSQLDADGLLTGEYWLSIQRKGKPMVTVQLTANIERLDFFPRDPRLSLPAELYKPFFVGDLLFIADPLTKVAQYIFYCIRDDEGGVFRVHDASPQKTITVLPFVMINSLFPGKFVGITNSQWEEIRSFTTFKNQPEVVNTSVGYEAYFDQYPGPNDPTVLDMIPSDARLQNGDTINLWSYDSSVYYTIQNIKLDAQSPTELGDDTKFLISGVYSLIRSKNLYEWMIEIVRNNVIVLSKIIPPSVTGIKFFVDPRQSLMQLQNSVVIGDVIKATITIPGSEDSVQYFWATNATMKLYTDGKAFMGTYDQLVQYLSTATPRPSQIVFDFSNHYSSTPFKTVTVPVTPTEASSTA